MKRFVVLAVLCGALAGCPQTKEQALAELREATETYNRPYCPGGIPAVEPIGGF